MPSRSLVAGGMDANFCSSWRDPTEKKKSALDDAIDEDRNLVAFLTAQLQD